MTAPPRQLFIGGTGRSGTSILGQTLGGHPQLVGIDQELRIHIDPGGALDLIHSLGPNWSPYVADAGIQDFLRLVGLSRKPSWWTLPAAKWGGRLLAPKRYATLRFDSDFGAPTVDEAARALLASISIGESRSRWTGTRSFAVRPKFFETAGPQDVQESARQFFDTLFTGRAHQLDKDIRGWVDHTPFNALHAERLSCVFPDAVFVLVVRDPVDVLASYMEQDWGSDTPLLSARRLLAVMRRSEEQLSTLAAHRVLRVRLEDMVMNPQEVLNEVLGQVGLEAESHTVRKVQAISNDAVNRRSDERLGALVADRATSAVISECRAIAGYE